MSPNRLARLFPFLALVSLAACGGALPSSEGDASPPEPVQEDGGRVPSTVERGPVGLDAGEGEGETGAPPCGCFGADFGTLLCGGIQRPDAESCLVCGGHCTSNPSDSGALD